MPSAIWWWTSTMTATLMGLAVGHRMSPLTEKASPVSRLLAAMRIVPGKLAITSPSRRSSNGGWPAGAPAIHASAARSQLTSGERQS
ncbi:MAG: hypothetical protein ACM3SU_00795 [Acidobacteriota bacterium]